MNKNIVANKKIINELLSILDNAHKKVNLEISAERYINRDDLLLDLDYRLKLWDSHCNLSFERKFDGILQFHVNSYGYTYIYINQLDNLDDVDEALTELVKVYSQMTKKWVLTVNTNQKAMNNDPLLTFMTAFIKNDFSTLAHKSKNDLDSYVYKITNQIMTLNDGIYVYQTKIHLDVDKLIFIQKNHLYCTILKHISNFKLISFNENTTYFQEKITNEKNEEIIYETKDKYYRIFIPQYEYYCTTPANFARIELDKDIKKKYWAFS